MMAPPLLPPRDDATVRIRPQHGPPRCVVEHVLQHVWRHKLLWYICAVVTAVLALQLGLGDVLHY